MKNEITDSAGIVTAQSADYEYNTLMRLLGVSVSKHLLDEHFTLVWANDFYYELIGWPKEEYEEIFHNRPDLYYEDFQDEWKELTETVMETVAKHQNGYRLVAKMPQKGGGHVWVQICNSFSDEYVNGYQVSYTVMTNIDDLVRVQKEQSVTYSNLPGFVAKFRVDGDGFRFLYANDRFTESFEEFSENGLYKGITNYGSEQNHSAYRQNFPLMRAGKPVHFTLQAKDRSGGDMWLQVNGDCVDWLDGNPVYLIIYIDVTDITEQRELQKQLEERSEMLHNALESAEQANRAKSEFLSRMSHDIRTPMNAIIGMTAIAGTHIDDKERVLNCLEKITLSSKLLLSLINEVLDMARIESGRIALSEEEFSLSDLLQNIITVMQPSIMDKNHRFNIHAYGLRHENVIGDPQRIQQVFLNILSNAVKYTPDDGEILFEIREKPSQIQGCGCYEFSFQDNGYGMKPEFLKKLFTPFERADDADVRSIQGTGLGMAISQNIVRMMNGDIQVESVYGKGSKFTVILYLEVCEEEKLDLKLKETFPVLVVDDDRIACETVCERLDEIGLSSRWVLSGEEAVEEVEKNHRINEDFLAVIIDLTMPGMNGIETTRKIRAVAGPDIPIILISAYDWLDYEEEALAAGANGFVVKPMLKSNLVYTIKKYVLKENVESNARPQIQSERSYKGKRLLLVEDNAFNREIAEEILGQTGFAVETAENGLEAVEQFSAVPEFYYDLVFMDLQMPVMDGLEAARRIRSMDRKDAAAVPIIAMTANAMKKDMEASISAGMNAHLVKPLELELLYQVIEKYMGG
ncbi:PAS domain-containing hybrid sensor histidine kinase/response regulator [Qiania dongpingensis]|uniref:Stage 0 sporulation protein A homolog n=1 Tax=Qiania dongpingensis TaxID=2763669 RepID=A0A7G9G3H0_9FIRM|nr:response regulator [Qiania dongpingensis]QNM05352.1 response regulator [Qiania dongpingensis]